MTSELNTRVSYLSPEITGLDLEALMGAALAEAEQAGSEGELPIGAVVVIDGVIVSRGRAQHQRLRSQLRHAELNAMLDGGERLWADYERAVLFTTVEPCPLCLGAAVMADIPHIIFALHDEVVHSHYTVQHNPYVNRHIKSYYGGVCAEQSAAIFSRYNPEVLEYILTGKNSK
ncbi:MAG: nucleoside deaminase [Anaerolineales bacterium]|nr:nucleoside deaminase [Anaerolineales bacterium]